MIPCNFIQRHVEHGSFSFPHHSIHVPPLAVGCSGFGAGLLVGANVQTIIYLIFDYFTLESISGQEGGLIFALQAQAQIGSLFSMHTNESSAVITSARTFKSAGLGSNIALMPQKGQKGVFCSVSMEGGICKSRDKINEQFYGLKKISATEILLSGKKLDIPDGTDGKAMMEEVYEKLYKICSPDNENTSGSNLIAKTITDGIESSAAACCTMTSTNKNVKPEVGTQEGKGDGIDAPSTNEEKKNEISAEEEESSSSSNGTDKSTEELRKELADLFSKSDVKK